MKDRWALWKASRSCPSSHQRHWVMTKCLCFQVSSGGAMTCVMQNHSAMGCVSCPLTTMLWPSFWVATLVDGTIHSGHEMYGANVFLLSRRLVDWQMLQTSCTATFDTSLGVPTPNVPSPPTWRPQTTGPDVIGLHASQQSVRRVTLEVPFIRES